MHTHLNVQHREKLKVGLDTIDNEGMRRRVNLL